MPSYWTDGMNNRDERYDFYKGLLIIGVVLGHVFNALQAGMGKMFWIHEFVRTYDMPMFAFISGLFLKKSCEKRSPFNNIINKASTLLFPALLWSWFFALLSGEWRPTIGGGLWFLYSLFFCSVIIIIIDQIKTPLLQIVCFAVITFVFHTVIIDPVNIGFLLPPAVIGYYSVGIKKKYNECKPNSIRAWNWIFIFCFIVAQCFWKQNYSVWNQGCNLLQGGEYVNNAKGIAYRFITGVLGCFVMENCFSAIYDIITTEKKPVFEKIKKQVVAWGQMTMELYILHAWIISVAAAKCVLYIVRKLGYNPFLYNDRLLLCIIAPCITVFSLLILSWLAKQIKKIPVIGQYLFSINIKKSSHY